MDDDRNGEIVVFKALELHVLPNDVGFLIGFLLHKPVDQDVVEYLVKLQVAFLQLLVVFYDFLDSSFFQHVKILDRIRENVFRGHRLEKLDRFVLFLRALETV